MKRGAEEAARQLSEALAAEAAARLEAQRLLRQQEHRRAEEERAAQQKKYSSSSFLKEIVFPNFTICGRNRGAEAKAAAEELARKEKAHKKALEDAPQEKERLLI